MKSFGHLDYLGDAILQLFAYEYRPNDPDWWLKKYASNKYLDEVYQKINLDDRFLAGFKQSKPNGKHGRASYVEAWLGEAYEIAGLEGARETWKRIQVIMGVAT